MTTIVTSTIPAVCDAFLEKVANLPEFVDVQVTYGHPGGDLETTSLWLADASPWMQGLVVSPGAAARKESYSVDGNLWVLSPGNSAVEARDIAFGLFAAMEKATRGVAPNGQTDLTLGVPGVLTALLVPRSARPLIADEGYWHHIEFGLEVGSPDGAGAYLASSWT